MAAVADLIVDGLRAAGVRTLFGVPGGGSNLDLIAAAGAAGLPFVLTATETAGAIAALAQAEATGGLGACLTTLGPGAASVVNGGACAFLERAPIVVPGDAIAIRGLCERRNVPAMVTYKAKGVVPDDHRWFAGGCTNAAIEQRVIRRRFGASTVACAEVETERAGCLARHRSKERRRQAARERACKGVRGAKPSG